MAFSAGILPLIATGASTAVTLASTYNAMKGQQRAGEFNAKLSEQEAKLAQQEAARDEEALRREQHSFFGKQRAALAEAGLSPGGTSGLLADQSAVLAELDALNVRYAGTSRGTGLLSDAAASRFGARQSSRGSRALAGAQLIQGVGEGYRAYRSLPAGA